jgi:ubiquinone/menaquinone biosynthesis C-methylase UbiE
VSESPSVYFAAVQATAGWNRVLETFAEFCRVEPGCRVLDVGCGPGGLASHFSARSCRTVGLDRDHSMAVLAAAAGGNGFRGTRGDAQHLPFTGQGFDLVTATNVIFLIDQPQAGVAEMARVVRRGGRLAMLNPSERMSTDAAARLADEHGLTGIERTSLLGWAHAAEDRQRFSEEETRRLIEGAGCRIIQQITRIGAGLARLTLAERVT